MTLKHEQNAIRLRNMRYPRWNDDEEKMLALLWREGLTGSEIAGRMGRTRSQVLAKARRLALASRKDCVGRKLK